MVTPGRPIVAERSPVRLEGWVDAVAANGARFTLRHERGLAEVTSGGRPNLAKQFAALRPEWVVAVTGDADDDPPSTIAARNLTTLNRSEAPKFTPRTRLDASPAMRARFRYLEFRDPRVVDVFRLRHKIVLAIINALDQLDFISVETPILGPVSGSGAREFRVVSERDPTLSYALPQSPQVYGHLLVAGGLRRYYQIARCFRDEDLRANRQPEFTQLHIEMGFVDTDAVIRCVEAAVLAAYAAAGRARPTFHRITHAQSLRVFGSDKPDLRLDPPIERLPHVVEVPGRPDRCLLVLAAPEGLRLDPPEVDAIAAAAPRHHFDFLGYIPHNRARPAFAPLRLAREQVLRHFAPSAEHHPGAVGLWEGAWSNVDALRAAVIATLRSQLRSQAPGPRRDTTRFAWVTDFPLFLEEGGKLVAANQPFTAPARGAVLDGELTRKQLLRLPSSAFDLVLDGEELGSGSILIGDYRTQQRVLELLGWSRKAIRKHFGYVLEALRYGAPPVGGFGLGLDRFVAGICGEEKIRRVIAFPKSKQGYCAVTYRSGEIGSRTGF